MNDKLKDFKARVGQAKQFPAKGKAKNNFFKISRRFVRAKNDLKMIAAGS
jgi:hypothetical protein